MSVRNQPLATWPSAADSRSYPYRVIDPVLARSTVQVQHMCEREICARRDAQIVRFQADGAVVFIKSPNEVTTDLGGSHELQKVARHRNKRCRKHKVTSGGYSREAVSIHGWLN